MNYEINVRAWCTAHTVFNNPIPLIIEEESEDGERDLVEFDCVIGISKEVTLGDKRIGYLIREYIERNFKVAVESIATASITLEDLATRG